MEMRCYRKVLRISYKDHVTNEEVRAKIQQAIGPHEDPPDHRKETLTEVVWSCLPFTRSGKVQSKGEKDKADRKRGGKTTSGNGQTWILPNPRGQCRKQKIEVS